ncbi:maleylpyruvate isomerase family mycothiol-dependent enzyme [Streptomyces katsurahamanus]|uniref:Maleylpyruvate isomerase family mycothiol-dependent enzyme n=1 Tax=Streptomyces katsurahamanus TaxID=2577098 RepID=A0ABW9NSB2_9ACTN|nr:maleylpyruvate isomerase family mycothiol-dependent enzyme [Streptomyces katsurahamanus]MQS36198.1 maleylpyruvate isomerase family mycothiol-dependent enzyme [Streptomyces katsurahamanus]
MDTRRDPELPGLLLRTERDALIPLLRSRPGGDFAIGTCCTGWTVRDVLAHCSAALMRVVEGRFEKGVFSPESNDRDIAERADWPDGRIVDELERGMTEAGPVIAAAGHGKLDVIAFGEWVHAGDVREAFGEPGAYEGDGLPHVLALLEGLTRASGAHPLLARLDGHDAPFVLGADSPEPAVYTGAAATLVRLLTGRAVTGARYELTGAEEADLVFLT